MKIREAVKSDIEPVLVLLKEFQEESLDEYGLFCDEQVARKMMLEYEGNTLIMESENAIIGVIAGFVASYPLNEEKVFQEAIWYVRKGYRTHGVKLLRALESWCWRRGIKKVVMVHMANSMPEKLKRFYESLGYRPLETHYIKEIK